MRWRAAIVLTGLAAAAVFVVSWEPSALLPVADPDVLPPFAIARIGRARFWGLTYLSPFEWTPDSREIVALCGSRIRVFDAATGLVAREFDATIEQQPASRASLTNRVKRWFRKREPPSYDFNALVLSHDGRFAAVGSAGCAAVFDLASGRRVAERRLDRPLMAEIAFLASDRALLIAASDGLHRWDFEADTDRVLASATPVEAVAVSADHVYAGLGKEVVEIDGDTLEVRRRTTVGSSPVTWLSCSPNGEWIGVFNDRFHSDGVVIASGDFSPTTISGTLPLDPEWLATQFPETRRTSPDGKVVAENQGSMIEVTATYSGRRVPEGTAVEAVDFAVLADGRTLAARLRPKGIALFDLRTGALQRELPASDRNGHAIVADAEAPCFLVQDFPSPTVWDLTGTPRALPDVTPMAAVLRLRGGRPVWIEPDLPRVFLNDATGAAPTRAELLGVSDSTSVSLMTLQSSALFDHGRRLAALDGGIEGPLRIWDCVSGSATDPAWGAAGVQAFAGAADADLLAISDSSGWSIRETATGREVRKFATASSHRADTAAFAPGAQRVALGEGLDIRVADLATEHTVVLTGHQGDVRRLAFTNDGTLLVSGADDGTILVWDVSAAMR